jgi:hypothetical protein
MLTAWADSIGCRRRAITLARPLVRDASGLFSLIRFLELARLQRSGCGLHPDYRIFRTLRPRVVHHKPCMRPPVKWRPSSSATVPAHIPTPPRDSESSRRYQGSYSSNDLLLLPEMSVDFRCDEFMSKRAGMSINGEIGRIIFPRPENSGEVDEVRPVCVSEIA